MFGHKASSVSLTKDFILSKLREQDIFSFYLRLGFYPRVGDSILSPFRKDKVPSCYFFTHKSGFLWLKDFGGDFSGDCINLVQQLYNLGFYEALKRIAEDFRLEQSGSVKSTYESNYIEREKYKPKKKVIQVKRQLWTPTDVEYWKSFHLNSKILKEYQVSSCYKVWIEYALIYNYTKVDPCYCYYFENGDYKLYYPFRDQMRFIHNNSSILQGYKQLPKQGDLLIITKSLKDVMVLSRFGIPAVAPQAESIQITEAQYKELKSRFNHIFLLYDFDRAGIKTSLAMSHKYCLPYLFLTNGRFNTRDYKAKDISDFVRSHGIRETQELIKQTLQELNFENYFNINFINQ